MSHLASAVCLSANGRCLQQVQLELQEVFFIIIIILLRISKPANLLLPGVLPPLPCHSSSRPVTIQDYSGLHKVGKDATLRGPAHPFKDLDTAKGFLRGPLVGGGETGLRRSTIIIYFYKCKYYLFLNQVF